MTDPIHAIDWAHRAREWAIAAGEITLRHFGPRVASEEKADGTPVTVADREAESYLREAIARAFPHHGILGEEFGEDRPGAAVRWILDPIDGTLSFERGVPLYGVLIGVEAEGEAVAGVAHFPALGETVHAAKGGGCFLNGRPCRVSGSAELREALLLTTSEVAIRRHHVAEGWGRLTDRVRMVRSWGDCYGHMLVATGRAEIMVDAHFSLWDAAPLLPIVEEAGGRFTDLEGRATIHGGSGLSTNGRLHPAVLELLSGS